MKDLTEKRQRLFEGGAQLNAREMADVGIVAHTRIGGSNSDVYLVREETGAISATLVEKPKEGEGVTVSKLDSTNPRYPEFKSLVTAAVDYIDSTSLTEPVFVQNGTTTGNSVTTWYWYGGTTKPELKPNYRFNIASVDIIDESNIHKAAFVKAGIDKQPDLLYVRFKLMHEGGNKNLDWFDTDQLQAAASTPIHKPLNWDHGEPTIGHIYYSEFVPAQANAAIGTVEGAHIIAEAAVYKFRYPKFAKKMIARHQKGMLAFSMEAYFTEAECSQCGEIFAAADHPDGTYCDHLNKRFEPTAGASGQSPVFRKLRGFILGGAGVVEDPADVGAEALALAKTKEERTLDKIELTQAELDAIKQKALEEARAEVKKEANVEELRERAETAEKELSKAKEALASATQTVEKLTAERDEAVTAKKALEEKVAFETKANERRSVLDEAGYAAPEKKEEAESAFATIMDMSNDVFTLFIAQVKSGSKKPTGAASASARVPAAGGTTKASVSSDDKPGYVQAAELLARL